MLEVIEQMLGYYDGKHAVAQKFQSLVGVPALLIFIGVGGVGKRLVKQILVLKV